jgi:leader peptidase (prepilin peptidase) / N-methyltransferase
VPVDITHADRSAMLGQMTRGVRESGVDLSNANEWLYLVSLFIFGLVFGSFGNVVIWRLPRGESLSHPGSHCPKCRTPIRWYDNIPLLSWMLLRARCRKCGEPISWRYPAVELTSGLLWLGAGWRFGWTPAVGGAIAFLYLLLLLAFIDWDTMRLPNSLVGLLFGIGLLGATVSQLTPLSVTPLLAWTGEGPLTQPLAGAALGAILGGGVVLLISLTYAAVRKTQGMGMGDVKLLAAIGVYLGPYSIMALFLGTMLGAAYGLIPVRGSHEGGRRKFPFGPFLASGGALTLFFGPQIWSWYASLAKLGM